MPRISGWLPCLAHPPHATGLSPSRFLWCIQTELNYMSYVRRNGPRGLHQSRALLCLPPSLASPVSAYWCRVCLRGQLRSGIVGILVKSRSTQRLLVFDGLGLECVSKKASCPPVPAPYARPQSLVSKDIAVGLPGASKPPWLLLVSVRFFMPVATSPVIPAQLRDG